MSVVTFILVVVFCGIGALTAGRWVCRRDQVTVALAWHTFWVALGGSFVVVTAGEGRWLNALLWLVPVAMHVYPLATDYVPRALRGER